LAAIFSSKPLSRYASRALQEITQNVEILSDYSLKVELKRPFARFPEMLADAQTLLVPANETHFDLPSGSGPFELCSLSKIEIVMQRRKSVESSTNPGLVDQLRFMIPETVPLTTTEIMRKKIDFFPFVYLADPENLPTTFSRLSISSQRIRSVILNIPQFEVRRALATCLNKDALMRHPFLKNDTRRFDYALPLGIEGFAPESGHVIEPACIPYSGKIQPPIKFLSNHQEPGSFEFMVSFADNWGKKAGLNISPEQITYSSGPERISSHKYDIALLGIGPKGPLADGLFLEFVKGGTPRSVLSFVIPKIDKAYETYAKRVTENDLSLYSAERSIRDSFVAIPLGIQTLTVHFNRKWKKFSLTTTASGVMNLSQIEN
jgi:hypothetical protein